VAPSSTSADAAVPPLRPPRCAFDQAFDRSSPGAPARSRPECVVVLPNHAPGAQRVLDLLSSPIGAQRSGAFSYRGGGAPGRDDSDQRRPSPARMAGSTSPSERAVEAPAAIACLHMRRPPPLASRPAATVRCTGRPARPPAGARDTCGGNERARERDELGTVLGAGRRSRGSCTGAPAEERRRARPGRRGQAQ